jgi:hypothetical protein
MGSTVSRPVTRGSSRHESCVISMWSGPGVKVDFRYTDSRSVNWFADDIL